MKERDAVTKEEIKTFFQRKIKPKLANLEIEKKSVLRKLFFLHTFIAAISGYLISVNDTEMSVKLIIPVGIALSLFGQKLVVSGFRKRFKSEVIKDLFQVLIKDCVYRPDDKINVTNFKDSQLVISAFNEFHGEDFVSGKIGDMKVEFSEIHAIHARTDSKGRKQETTIFSGLFYVFTLNVDLKQNTLILKDQAESLLGRNLGRFIQKKSSRPGYELVQLESVEFEKKFVVYSNDQIKSRVLLKPTVLENLISFKKKFREPIEVSIRGNKLYVGIQTTKNHFEPKLLGEVINFKEIREIYDLVQLVRDLQEDLDLESLAA